MSDAKRGSRPATQDETHDGSDSSDDDERRGPRRRPTIELVDSARRQLEAMTRKPVESASAVVQRDGGWCVTLEVVELERIPATTSILGSYEAQVDGDGNLVAYERIRRYARSDADYGGGS